MEGGYGWIIVCATFLINGIVQGVIASSGILLNVLLDQFKVGKAITGWIPSLLGGLLLAVGKHGTSNGESAPTPRSAEHL